MRTIKETTKCVVAAFAFCFLFAVSMLAEAATYKPGVTYVDPEVNSKGEYYSVLKKRMSTYSDDTIDVVYPKGATFSVTTSKKALQAQIISQTFESLYYDDSKFYINATPDPATVTTRYYYLTKDGRKWELTEEAGRYYKEFDGNKVYLTPNRTERYVSGYAVKVAELSDYPGVFWDSVYDEKHDDGYYNLYSLYDDGDGKGYYYYRGNGEVCKNGMVVQTPDGQADYEYSKATIQLTSTKAGTYTVNVNVNGKATKLKVYVTTYGGDKAVSVALGKTALSKYSRKASDNGSTISDTSDYRVKSTTTSGKLKIKADKGIKITGLVVASVDKNGKAVYKKVKNGKKISLSKELEYKYIRPSGYYSKDARKYTYVYVSYKDSYLGTYTTYSLTTKHGVKQIKRTIKYASDSKKYVDYLDYGEGCTFDIWTY